MLLERPAEHFFALSRLKSRLPVFSARYNSLIAPLEESQIPGMIRVCACVRVCVCVCVRQDRQKSRSHVCDLSSRLCVLSRYHSVTYAIYSK